jgi:hypothetical protein
VGDLAIALAPADAADVANPVDVAYAVTDRSGAFTFDGVAPGTYVARAMQPPGGESRARGEQVMVVRGGAIVHAAQPPLPSDPLLWAEATVVVDSADIKGVNLALRPGASIRGRVEFRGAATPPQPPALQAISIGIDRADGRGSPSLVSARGRVEASSTFATAGVPAGRYVLRVAQAPAGWFFAGAMLNGRDLSSQPFDLAAADLTGVTLVFSDRTTTLDGTIAQTSGGPDAAATAVVFPVDRSAWIDNGAFPRRLRETRADASGAFSVSGLPPGDYFVAAVPERVATDWRDPARLDRLSQTAARVTIVAAETARVALRTIADVR